MTRRHELDSHRHKLREIRNIMHSMKTLAVMETHKLERCIETQNTMTKSIENIAADFLHFHPLLFPSAEPASNIILLIGSERGFCGNFNEQIVKQLSLSFADSIQQNTTLITVGRKLQPLLSEHDHNIIYIEGANVAEEIFSVLDAMAQTLETSQQPASLYVLHHNNQRSDLVVEKLLPPFEQTDYQNTNESNPPLLNLTTRDFFLELTDHYLFSALHRILYISLMAENQNRIHHLEHATNHLDDKTAELGHKINALRQEEIIEEIEVILLNASSS